MNDGRDVRSFKEDVQSRQIMWHVEEKKKITKRRITKKGCD